MSEQDRTTRWLTATACWIGSRAAIVFSVVVVILWAVVGPLFRFSDAWQFLMVTPVSIITLWIGLIIQFTQNIEARATQTKLDAIVQALEGADNSLTGLEERPEAEIKRAQRDVRRSDDPSDSDAG